MILPVGFVVEDIAAVDIAAVDIAAVDIAVAVGCTVVVEAFLEHLEFLFLEFHHR